MALGNNHVPIIILKNSYFSRVDSLIIRPFAASPQKIGLIKFFCPFLDRFI